MTFCSLTLPRLLGCRARSCWQQRELLIQVAWVQVGHSLDILHPDEEPGVGPQKGPHHTWLSS